MEMTNSQYVPASPQAAWDALNDPEVLKTCIPGCEVFERTSDSGFDVGMTARVGPVSAKFKGRLELADIVPPTGYSLSFEGQGGAAGFGKGTASVRLEPEGEGTRLHYSAQAMVGGKLAQIGSRLIDGAAKKIAEDFFARFNAHFAPPAIAGAEVGPPVDEAVVSPAADEVPAATMAGQLADVSVTAASVPPSRTAPAASSPDAAAAASRAVPVAPAVPAVAAGSNTIAWIALAVAVLALLVALFK